MNDSISIKGDRELWIDFVSKVKKDHKEVWEVLSKYIKDYLKRWMNIKGESKWAFLKILKMDAAD